MPVGRKIVDDTKAGGGEKKQSHTHRERLKKRKLNIRTEFPEGGNTTSTKDPWHPNGGYG